MSRIYPSRGSFGGGGGVGGSAFEYLSALPPVAEQDPGDLFWRLPDDTKWLVQRRADALTQAEITDANIVDNIASYAVTYLQPQSYLNATHSAGIRVYLNVGNLLRIHFNTKRPTGAGDRVDEVTVSSVLDIPAGDTVHLIGPWASPGTAMRVAGTLDVISQSLLETYLETADDVVTGLADTTRWYLYYNSTDGKLYRITGFTASHFEYVELDRVVAYKAPLSEQVVAETGATAWVHAMTIAPGAELINKGGFSVQPGSGTDATSRVVIPDDGAYVVIQNIYAHDNDRRTSIQSRLTVERGGVQTAQAGRSTGYNRGSTGTVDSTDESLSNRSDIFDLESGDRLGIQTRSFAGANGYTVLADESTIGLFKLKAGTDVSVGEASVYAGAAETSATAAATSATESAASATESDTSATEAAASATESDTSAAASEVSAIRSGVSALESEAAQDESEAARLEAQEAQAAAEAAAAAALSDVVVNLGAPTGQVGMRLDFDAPDGITQPAPPGIFYAFTTGTLNYDADGDLVIRIGAEDRNVFFDLDDTVQLSDMVSDTPYLVHAIGSQLWMLTPSVHHRNILDATIVSWNGAILELSGFRNNLGFTHRPLVGDTLTFVAPLIASDRATAAQVQFDIDGVGTLFQLRDHLNRTIPANEVATRQIIVATFSGNWYAAIAAITSRDLLPETAEATRGYSVQQHDDDEGYGLVNVQHLPTATPDTRGYTVKQSETDETFYLADVVIPAGSSSSGGGYGHYEYHLYQWASAPPVPPVSPYDTVNLDFRTDFGDWEANRGTAEAAALDGEIEYIANTYMDILSDGTVVLSTWNINIAFDHQWSEDGETWRGVFSQAALFERFRLADGNWSPAIRIADGIDGWVNLVSLTYNYIASTGQLKAISLDDAFNATNYHEMRIRIRAAGAFGSDQRDGGTAEATLYRPHRFGDWTVKNVTDNDNDDVDQGTIKTYFHYQRGLELVAATGVGMDASIPAAIGPEGNDDANPPRAFGWLMHIVANSTINLNDIKKFRFNNFNRNYARAELSIWVR